jgi:hypothetical protein
MSKRCNEMTKAGNRCKAVAVEGGLCAFHADPTRAARLGRKGGRRNRRRPPHRVKQFAPPRTAKEIREILSTTMADIQNGQTEPKIGSVLAYVGAALLKAIETTETEERLDALERAVKLQQ